MSRKRLRPDDLRLGLKASSLRSKKRRIGSGGYTSGRPGRVGYSTVARTRGVYAHGEMKYADAYLDPTALVAAPTWAGTEVDNASSLALHAVPTQGSGIHQRIGQKIDVHGIKIRGSVAAPKAANLTAGKSAFKVRIILFMDMQTNATQAQGEQVMDNDFASGGIDDGTLVFQNINNFGRFKVLKDFTLVLQNPNTSYDGTNIESNGLVRPFKCNIKFRKPVRIQFNATGGATVADISTTSFHMLANCDNIDLAPTITWASRMTYKDA